MSSDQIQKAVDVLVSFGAKKVILFGSMLDMPESARDLDLAAEGIPLSKILDADLALNEVFDLPVDLLVQEDNPELYEIIKDYGKPLYG